MNKHRQRPKNIANIISMSSFVLGFQDIDKTKLQLVGVKARTWGNLSGSKESIIRFLDNTALIDALRMTTLHFETYNQQSTTVYDNLLSEYTQRLMKAIVAFEVEVKEMDTVFKLSQERDAKSYDNIIKQLRQHGESGQVIAAEIKRRTKEVVPEHREQDC